MPYSKLLEIGNLFDSIGNISSLLGLLITVLILIFGYIINNKIHDIQRSIQFNTRIKEMMNQLNNSKSNLPKYLRESELSYTGIRYEIKQSDTILKNIKAKLKKDERGNMKVLFTTIKSFKKATFEGEIAKRKSFLNKIKYFLIDVPIITKDNIWDFYSELSAFITHLNNLIEDKKNKII